MSAAYIQMDFTLLLSWKQTIWSLMRLLRAVWSSFKLFAIKGAKINKQMREQKTIAVNGEKNWHNKSKEEGKDQEWIQSSTTPCPGHHMGKWEKHKKRSYIRDK